MALRPSHSGQSRGLPHQPMTSARKVGRPKWADLYQRKLYDSTFEVPSWWRPNMTRVKRVDGFK
eukprot:2931166-Amphidinium_carterae.1